MTKRGITPLHAAAAGGDLTSLEMLLTAKADILLLNTEGRNALHQAAGALDGGLKALELLFSSGGEMGRRDKHGQGLLHHAARNGNNEVITWLLGSCPLKVEFIAEAAHRDRWGRLPLHWASLNSHAACAALLLGVFPSAIADVDHGDEIPLHLTCHLLSGRDAGRSETLSHLVSSETHFVSSETHLVSSETHLVSSETHLEAVLIGKSLPLTVDIQEQNGRTALHLLAAHVPPSDSTADRCIVLNSLVEKMISILLHAKASLEIKDKFGMTPLLAAAQVGNLVAVRVLVDSKADLGAREPKGQTALDLSQRAASVRKEKWSGAKASASKVSQLIADRSLSISAGVGPGRS